MKKRAWLGREISRIALGTVPLGSALDVSLSMDMLDAYSDLGGNFIDLARAYGDGAAERTVGAWLRRQKRDVFLATKGGLPGPDRAPRLDAKNLTDDLLRSLDALGVEQVDLYWLHRDDVNRPVEDILCTLNRFAQDGRVRYIGASNWTLARLNEADICAKSLGYMGFSASQPQWSLARMTVCEDPTLVQMDENMRSWHRKTDLACVPFSSQAKGFFQKLAAGGPEALSDKARRRYLCEGNMRLFDAILEIRQKTGLNVGAIALGYLIGQSFPVFPIAGASSVEQTLALEDADLPVWALEKLESILATKF